MPKIKLNALIDELQGPLYGTVVNLSPQGELIIAKRPDMSRVKWSKAQKATPSASNMLRQPWPSRSCAPNRRE